MEVDKIELKYYIEDGQIHFGSPDDEKMSKEKEQYFSLKLQEFLRDEWRKDAEAREKFANLHSMLRVWNERKKI